jgi:hypothetical protein
MTTTYTPKRKTRRPPVAVRKAKREAQRQVDQLTDQIMTQGQQQEALAKAAAAVTQGYLTDAEVLAWRQEFNARLDTLLQHSEQNLGFAEEELAPLGNQLLRLGAERLAQAKANATPCRCLKCDLELEHQRYLSRKIDSRFGRLRICRLYGQCPGCEQWHFPADHALGPQANAPASPYVQEISAGLVTKMTPEQACAVAQRVWLGSEPLLSRSRGPSAGPQDPGGACGLHRATGQLGRPAKVVSRHRWAAHSTFHPRDRNRRLEHPRAR